MTIYRRLHGAGEFRHRTRATLDLPRLSAENEPQLHRACFDKLELEREFLLHFPGRAEVAADLKQMLQRDRIRLCGAALPDLIAFSGRGELYNSSSIVMRPAGPGAIPLCDALQLTFRGWPRPPDTFKITVSAKLNPSRVAAHARQRRLSIETADWRDLLFSDEQTRQALAEESLDRRDNLLPSSALMNLDAGPGVSGALHCLRALDELLIYLLGASNSEAEHGPREFSDYFAPIRESTGDWAIRQAEVYWEFGEGNATDRLIGLRSVIWASGHDVREDDYREHAPAGQLTRDGYGFSMRVNNKTRIRLYAKAENRVRVEVSYSKSPPVGAAHLPLRVRLDNVQTDAQHRARRATLPIYRLLQNEGAVRPSHAQFVDRLCELTQRLAALYPDADNYQRLLRTLLRTGGVDVGREAVITTEEALRLVTAGILTRDRVAHASRTGPNRFSLHAQYLGLFQRLYELEEREPAPPE